jgi:hypothetical protein
MHRGNRSHQRRLSSERRQRSACLECAAGCQCGRYRVPGSRIDRLRAPRNALLDHERSAQTRAPAIFLGILTVYGGPSPRSIAYLPDRRHRGSRDQGLRIIKSCLVAGLLLGVVVPNLADLRPGTPRRRTPGFPCVAICFSSATRDSRCTSTLKQQGRRITRRPLNRTGSRSHLAARAQAAGRAADGGGAAELGDRLAHGKLFAVDHDLQQSPARRCAASRSPIATSMSPANPSIRRSRS